MSPKRMDRNHDTNPKMDGWAKHEAVHLTGAEQRLVETMRLLRTTCNKVLARALGLAPRTVSNQLNRLREKLGVIDRGGILPALYEMGVIKPGEFDRRFVNAEPAGTGEKSYEESGRPSLASSPGARRATGPSTA